MRSESKTRAEPAAAPQKKGGDRKRLAYLKTRYKEVRAELETIKKEMTTLKAKLGAMRTGGKAKDAKRDKDDED